MTRTADDHTGPPTVDPLAVARRYFATAGSEAYFVGGCVRDLLLGREIRDTDLALRRGALDHARRIAAETGGGAVVPLDPDRDIARVVWPAAGRPAAILDIAAFTGEDLEEDLRNRDFTINAMAIPVTVDWPPSVEEVIDPTGGRSDIADGVIRMTSPEAFDADPLRMLRAMRFAAQLTFTLDIETRTAIKARSELLRLPARERSRDELLKLLAASEPAKHVAALLDLGLLDQVLPEVGMLRRVESTDESDADLLDYSLRVLAAMECLENVVLGDSSALRGGRDQSGAIECRLLATLSGYRGQLTDYLLDDCVGAWPRAVLLRLASLLVNHYGSYHGKEPVAGEPAGDPTPGRDSESGRPEMALCAEEAQRAVARLRLSANEIGFVLTAAEWSQRVRRIRGSEGDLRRRVHRFYKASGAAGVGAVLLALSRDLALRAPLDLPPLTIATGELLRGWFDERDTVINPPPLVTGDDLMFELGLEPGPEVGRLLSLLLEEQAAGEIADRAEALALAHRLLARRA